MNMLAFVGFAGSGKDAAAQTLVERGWAAVAFADALRDALAVIFHWPRHLLEDDTDEAQAWCECVDPWWANRLGVPAFSPRRATQLIGTEMMRDHLHPGIWIASIERRLEDLRCADVVITDARFPDEIAVVQRQGGRVIRIRRGLVPAWFPLAIAANAGDEAARGLLAWRTDLHVSEWSWIGTDLDATIENDGTVEDLRTDVTSLLCPMARPRTAMLA
jgi:hypothetical protein